VNVIFRFESNIPQILNVTLFKYSLIIEPNIHQIFAESLRNLCGIFELIHLYYSGYLKMTQY